MNADSDNPIENSGEPDQAKNQGHLAWGVAWPVGIGVGGSLLVFLFLTTFLHIYSAAKLIPWIIAFNGAVSGYSMVEKRRQLRHKKLLSAIIGAAIALITGGILVILSYLHIGENLLTAGDFAFYVIGGVIGSELGTLLGGTYFNLQKG